MENKSFDDITGSNLERKREEAYKATAFDELTTDLSYKQFFLQYLVPNRPCIFDSSLTKTWESRQKWVLKNGRPNFEYLEKMYGEASVPVANCNLQEYSAHPKENMTMREYLRYWQDYISKGHPIKERCLYLKDWHFTKNFPEQSVYTTPVYFQSDWLNEFWDTLPDDDYRFVYMGPKGTWTPFHSDVYRSFSWSANICGRKKWIFYPPGAEENLKDKFKNLVYDVMSTELEDVSKYPNAHKVEGQAIEVIQEQGQVIFVPSGWHHQVYNLEDTISINHNWLNGCNIDICWHHLHHSLQEVQREIIDCREMEGWAEQCQLILNASAGLDYRTFVRILVVIAENRLASVNQSHHGRHAAEDRLASVNQSHHGRHAAENRLASVNQSHHGRHAAENRLASVNQSHHGRHAAEDRLASVNQSHHGRHAAEDRLASVNQSHHGRHAAENRLASVNQSHHGRHAAEDQQEPSLKLPNHHSVKDTERECCDRSNMSKHAIRYTGESSNDICSKEVHGFDESQSDKVKALEDIEEITVVETKMLDLAEIIETVREKKEDDIAEAKSEIKTTSDEHTLDDASGLLPDEPSDVPDSARIERPHIIEVCECGESLPDDEAVVDVNVKYRLYDLYRIYEVLNDVCEDSDFLLVDKTVVNIAKELLHTLHDLFDK